MSLENISAEDRELAALMRQLAENPATRKDVLRLTKQIKPDLPIPELEIEQYTNSQVSGLKQEIEALRAERMQRDAEMTLEKRRQALVKKGLINSESEIDEVEKVMLEKKIADHETAAEYYQWMKQAAVPTSSTGYNPSPVKGFDLNKYWKNPVGAARDEAAKALNDLRRPNRPIGL